MADEKQGSNFWTTLPGILTGVAAVLTAAGGIFLGMHQSGASKENAKPDAAVSRAESSPSAAVVASMRPPEVQVKAAEPASPATVQPAGEAIPAGAVRVTKTDGVVLWSFEDKFGWGSPYIALDTGQLIPWSKIRSVDVLELDSESKGKLKIGLVNGSSIQGSSIQTTLGLRGTNDLGFIHVDGRQVKQVVFPH